MPETLHVLVEVRAADRGNAADVNFPGFEVDQLRVPPNDSDDTDRFVIRGIVACDYLDDLRRDPRVMDVYLDTEIAPYSGLFHDLLAVQYESRVAAASGYAVSIRHGVPPHVLAQRHVQL